ncbi:MAG: glutamate racemase, partial [Actinobacteria bacterium]|nr:glutamate racemase [Actinomycetota bacterium]
SFSIHGHTPELHDSLTRSKGSFEQTKQGIKNLIELAQPISTNTVVVKQNYKYLAKITEFLSNCEVKLIVVACNTSTAASLEDLKREFDIPIVGVIEPGARTAAGNTIKNKVGVIATKGTVASRDYEFAVKKINPDIDVYQVAAPLLVEYIERGVLDGSDLKKLICEYVEPLNQYDIDVLILGCTHFPIIEGGIKSCCNEGIKVISSAVETARDVRQVLGANQIKSEKSLKPGRIFYETGNASKFLEISKIFLGTEIKEVKKIKLNMY